MDIKKHNSIDVHLQDGSVLKFIASGNGLYQYSLKDHESMDRIWSLLVTTTDTNITINPSDCFNIDTVCNRADSYTKGQLKTARLARKLENIIMRPGSQKISDVCLPHLVDCPLTTADVRAANNIFGKNLGSLKGKTVHRSNPHVQTNLHPVPPCILQLHSEFTLAIDIMFVNKIPFLVTTSCKIHFGTVEALPNRQMLTVVAKIQSVVNTYQHRGFKISTILADNEFDPIRPWFPCLNTCAAREHVPDVERYIRTIKDSTRSTYRMLPYTRIPRLIIIHLVKNSVF